MGGGVSTFGLALITAGLPDRGTLLDLVAVAGDLAERVIFSFLATCELCQLIIRTLSQSVSVNLDEPISDELEIPAHTRIMGPRRAWGASKSRGCLHVSGAGKLEIWAMSASTAI